MEWIKGSPPEDREGIYLVWLSPQSLHAEHIQTCSIRKVSNGYMSIIGGLFDFDVLGDDCKIIAYISLNDLKKP